MKNPKKPLQGTSSLLRGAPDSEYKKQYNSYLTNMFISLSKEARSTDPINIIVFLAEKYHPEFRHKEIRGPKLKWSPPLKAMLAVTIEEMIASGEKRKSALYKLSKHPQWKQMIKEDSLDPCELLNKAAKEGKSTRSIYKFFKLVHETSDNWDDITSTAIKKSIFQD